MVKTFQLSRKGSYGKSIKIAPITTESISNEETCLEVNGTSQLKIQPQTIIPDTTGMEVKQYFLFFFFLYLYLTLNCDIQPYFSVLGKK